MSQTPACFKEVHRASLLARVDRVFLQRGVPLSRTTCLNVFFDEVTEELLFIYFLLFLLEH